MKGLGWHLAGTVALGMATDRQADLRENFLVGRVAGGRAHNLAGTVALGGAGEAVDVDEHGRTVCGAESAKG